MPGQQVKNRIVSNNLIIEYYQLKLKCIISSPNNNLSR